MLRHILQLERTLAVMDFETTGKNTDTDRIVQIALTMHYPHKDEIAWTSLVNPGIPIPKGASDVHGITDEMVQKPDVPTFAEIAPALAPRMINVDIMGYNVDFDISVLRAEMKRVGVDWPWSGHVIDAYQIFRRKHAHTLTNAYLEYGGEDGQPLEGRFEDAHDAGADVLATTKVLRGQLLRHVELPRTVKELASYCFPDRNNYIDSRGKIVWYDGVACITFGKHATPEKPLPLTKLDKGYMEWCIKAEFIAPDVKQIFRDALRGVYPQKTN